MTLFSGIRLAVLISGAACGGAGSATHLPGDSVPMAGMEDAYQPTGKRSQAAAAQGDNPPGLVTPTPSQDAGIASVQPIPQSPAQDAGGAQDMVPVLDRGVNSAAALYPPAGTAETYGLRIQQLKGPVVVTIVKWNFPAWMGKMDRAITSYQVGMDAGADSIQLSNGGAINTWRGQITGLPQSRIWLPAPVLLRFFFDDFANTGTLNGREVFRIVIPQGPIRDE